MASTTSAESISEGEKTTDAVPLCLPSNFRFENGELKHDEGSTRSDIVPCEEGLKLLEDLDEPLIVISITGPARSGKSFFLSQLQDGVKFPIGHSYKSHTTGIWMAVCPKIVEREGKPCRIVLLDAEGTGGLSTVDGGASDEWDTKVFTLCSLISSVLIYNSSGRPTRHDLQQLGFIANFSNSICQRSDSTFDVAREDIFKKYAARFIWLIRDAMLQSSSRRETCAGSDSDLNDYITNEVLCEKRAGHSSGNEVIRAINHTFSSTQAFGIPPPSINGDICRKLDDPSVADEIKVFLTKVKEVASEVVGISGIKKVHGGLVTGSKLVQLIKSSVEAINSDTKYLSWENMWDTVIKTDLRKALNICIQEYTNLLQSCKLPCPTSDLRTTHDVTYDKMLNKFQETTINTDQEMKRPFADELSNRMEIKFQNQIELNDGKSKDFHRQTMAELIQIHLHPFQNEENDENATYQELLKANKTVVDEYNKTTEGYAYSGDTVSECHTLLTKETALCTEKIISRAKTNALLEYDEICEPITEETVLTEHDLETEHAISVEKVKQTFKGCVDGIDDIEQLVTNLDQKLGDRLENRKMALKITLSTQFPEYINTLKSTYWVPRINRLPKVSFRELLDARTIILDKSRRKFGSVPSLKEQLDDLNAMMTDQLNLNVRAIIRWAHDDSIERFSTAVQSIRERVPCVETDELEETCNGAKTIAIRNFNNLVEGCETIGRVVDEDQQLLERNLGATIEAIRCGNEMKSHVFNTILMNDLIEECLVKGFAHVTVIADTDLARTNVLKQYDDRALGPTRDTVRNKYLSPIENEISRIKSRVFENQIKMIFTLATIVGTTMAISKKPP